VIDALFVYGSLRSEFDNAHARLLREEADFMGRATVRGSLFRNGIFPGYRNEPDGIVQGELWKLREPESTLAALDEYEGDVYSRISATTNLGEAWIYLYNGVVKQEERILSGDFVAQ
jgi:gamma-glutamylcyclotransferase (GGCT)/AIG2-like uncharacterized protein YtfP